MNSQSFDINKPRGKEKFLNLLNVLLDYNADFTNEDFNDIHIKQEECFIILEWENIHYNRSYDYEGWHFIEPDEVIMKDVTFPDGTSQYVFPDEVEDTLKKWHKEHPEWVKTTYGTWTNMEENRQWAITWNLKNWVKREVKEDDSTFSKTTLDFYQLGDVSNRVENAIKLAPKDVLYRTDYIVISPDLVFPKQEKETVTKLEDIDISFNYQIFGDKWETVDRTFHLYTDGNWPGKEGEIYYLTDNDYLIYKQELKS